jgi:hypothetical protein
MDTPKSCFSVLQHESARLDLATSLMRTDDEAKVIKTASKSTWEGSFGDTAKFLRGLGLIAYVGSFQVTMASSEQPSRSNALRPQWIKRQSRSIF